MIGDLRASTHSGELRSQLEGHIRKVDSVGELEAREREYNLVGGGSGLVGVGG